MIAEENNDNGNIDKVQEAGIGLKLNGCV